MSPRIWSLREKCKLGPSSLIVAGMLYGTMAELQNNNGMASANEDIESRRSDCESLCFNYHSRS
jgi:hypothetical protein